eukprot:1128962-Pelagomonas_calceolata.AAC.1
MAQELWGYCQQLHTLLSLVRPVFQDNIFHAPIDLGYTELTCCLSALTVGCFLGTCWFAAFQRLAIAGVRKPAKAVQLWNSSKGRCWSSRVWLADGFLGDSSWRNFGLDDCISSMVYLLAEVSTSEDFNKTSFWSELAKDRTYVHKTASSSECKPAAFARDRNHALQRHKTWSTVVGSTAAACRPLHEHFLESCNFQKPFYWALVGL